MEDKKEEILEELRKDGCVDDDTFYIIKSLPSPEERMRNPSIYNQQIRSLVASGLTEDQVIRIESAQMILFLYLSPLLETNYSKAFNEIYHRVKEWYQKKKGDNL